ncbi:hypothetical protein [Azospirillum griseum]|uniref:hypothetical protein n=1 Tax=Azospirillum griseum TaxID=2496639 RepID=UPI0013159E33|nr:hypothetical protein [Azospirillum griseum]
MIAKNKAARVSRKSGKHDHRHDNAAPNPTQRAPQPLPANPRPENSRLLRIKDGNLA